MRMSRWYGALGAMAALVLAASPASAQGITNALLSGVVHDSAGAPLAGVVVRVVAESGSELTVETSSSGSFSVSFLPPARYDVLVEEIGYRPRRVTGIPLRPGSDIRLDVMLAPATPPVERVDTAAYDAGALGASRAGVDQWLGFLPARGLPGERRGLALLSALSSESDPRLEVEGLPSRYSGIVVDGLPFSPVRHPDAPAVLAGAAFPPEALQGAELVTNGFDVEWAGQAGGYLGVFTRPGSATTRVLADGSWSGAALSSSKYFQPGDIDHTSLRGDFLVSGPMMHDSATFLVGVDAARVETPLAPWSGADPAAARQITTAAQDVYGVGLDAFAPGFARRNDLVTGFGRFDWRITPSNRLMIRANAATIDQSVPDVGAQSFAAAFPAVSGSDVTAGASLASTLGSSTAQQLELSFDRSDRDYGEAGIVAPATLFAADGVALNGGSPLVGSFSRTAVHLRDALFVGASAHRFKLGVEANFSSYDQTYAFDQAGTFFFGDAADFAAGRGAFVQAGGGAPSATFSIPEFGLFAQDTWRAAPGMDVRLGLRMDLEHVPSGKITLNEQWLQLTGLANDQAPSNFTSLSPRVSVAWDVQDRHEWILRAGGGVFYDRMDPNLFGELVADDGSAIVRRGVGTFTGWPAAPADTAIGPRLALVGPDFAPPRTERGSIGITRQLGKSALTLSATVRHTDFLPQRRDLNLAPQPSALDQYGRAVFGQLARQGGVLVARPGSNRRFPGFDVVSALEATASSDYAGLSVGVERFVGDDLRFFGRYTYSHTTDDWTWAGSQNPFSTMLATDSVGDRAWAQGTSDFDVPNRLTAGVSWTLPGRIAPAITVLYRYHSGYPFTPGFRAGVDANGDGSFGNDPAFVDPNVAGVADLVGKFDCLRSQTGRFAERNSCRQDGVHALDARLSFDLLHVGNLAGTVVLDGINLLESDVGVPDQALYLVDPAGSFGQSGGTVNVPLVANPHFGQTLVRQTTGRTFRLGIRVSY